MNLADFIAVIRKWKWILLPVVIIVTAFSIYNGSRSPSAYTSEASVAIGVSQIASGTPQGIGLANSADRIGATYAELVTARPVMEKALVKAGLNWDPGVLSSMVTSAPVKNSTVINIDVIDSEPQRATLLANSVGDAFVDYIQETSKNGTIAGRDLLLSEMTQIDKDLAAAQSPNSGADTALISSLQDRKQTILQQYSTLLEQQMNGGDIRVTSPANFAGKTGMPLTQKVAIGFAISLIVGIFLEFVAEALQNALRTTQSAE